MNIIKDILLAANFESSSTKTPQFLSFVKHFKRCFKREMLTIGVTNIKFNIGHFYISGFFIKNEQTYYFNISDVRGQVREMLFRTAKNDKDFTGGHNQYVTIGMGMAQNMGI